MFMKNIVALALVATIAPFPTSSPDAAEVAPATKQDLAEQACLVAAAWNEARGTPSSHVAAVMHVVVNRTRYPEYKPTVCGVVLQKGQFQMTQPFRTAVQQASKTGNFNVAGLKGADLAAMDRITALAALVINGQSTDPTKGATHFWSPSLRTRMGYASGPNWSKVFPVTLALGPFIFHKQRKS